LIPRSLVDGTGGSPRKGRYINDGRADATVVAALPLFVVIAVGAHLVMSGSQTLFHYSLGHHPLGGAFFRNHTDSIIPSMPGVISCWPAITATKETTHHTFLSQPSSLPERFILFSTRLLSRGGRCGRNVALCT
jgi:hypothetical protein